MATHRSLVVLGVLQAIITAAGFALSVDGDTPPKVQVVSLSETSHRKLAVPQFGFFNLPKSDNDGNLFFHVDKGSYNSTTLLRVSSDGNEKLLKLPGKLESAVYVAFFVTQTGQAFSLSQQGKSFLITQFGRDGNSKEPVELGIPSDIVIRDFGVFGSGEFLVAGFYGRTAEEGMRGKAFAAIVGENGALIRSLKKDPDVDLSHVFDRVHDGTVVQGTDGNLYIVRSNRMQVISPSAKELMNYKYDSPLEGCSVEQAIISGGRLAFNCGKHVGDRMKNVVALVELDSGSLSQIFELSPELGNVLVRFSREEGFTFFYSTVNSPELRTASLP